MWRAVKQSFEQKKQKWAEETQQRIAAYADWERQYNLERLKREEEENHILHEEIDRYLQTTHPSFLLKPEAQQAIRNRLHALRDGRLCFSLHANMEMHLAINYFNRELIIFIKLLERKGFRMAGKEEKFLQAFLNKLSANNYNICLERYGHFANEHDPLEQVFFRYIEVVDQNHKFESGHLDFFNKYLISKGFLPASHTKRKLKQKIKQFESLYAEDYKVREMERRLQGIS